MSDTPDGVHRITTPDFNWTTSSRHERLNRELRDGCGERWLPYAQLRNRVARLIRLRELNGPQIIVDKEFELVERALHDIDPHWRDQS
jgi:hypothetical protein